MEALEILIKARAKIAHPEGWGKGRRKWDRGVQTCCAAEAIEDSDPCGYEIHYSERKRASRALMHAAGLDRAALITGWNDNPGRTHSEVLAAFDLAIAMLKLRLNCTHQ